MTEHSPETTPPSDPAVPHVEAAPSVAPQSADEPIKTVAAEAIIDGAVPPHAATSATAFTPPAAAVAAPSLMPLIGAALGGAAIAVVVTAILVSSGLIAAPQSPLAQKAVEGAQAQVSALATKIETLNALSAKIDQFAALSTKVETLANKPVPVPDISAQLAPLNEKLASLDKALSTEVALPKATPAQIGGLSARLDQAENGVSDLVSKLGQSSDQITSNTAALTSLSAKMTALETSGQQEASQIVALTGQVAQAQALIKGAQIRLDQVESAIQQMPDQRRLAVLGVASAALTRAASSGRGFAVELAAVSDLAPDLAALKDLNAYAKDGAPVALDLAKTLPDKAILNSVAIAKNAGVSDRVWASMKSWVNYRAKGDPSSGVDTAVGTMADALTKGDVPAALASWQTLPDAAKGASEPWGSQLRARAAVDAGIAALTAQLSTQLNAK